VCGVGTGVHANALQTLTEHWDGSTWSIVPSPSQGTGHNYLRSVAVVGTSDIWAVGYISFGTTSQTLIEHWDGSSWSIVSNPNPGDRKAWGRERGEVVVG